MNKKTLKRRFKIRGATIKLLVQTAAQQEAEIARYKHLLATLQDALDAHR